MKLATTPILEIVYSCSIRRKGQGDNECSGDLKNSGWKRITRELRNICLNLSLLPAVSGRLLNSNSGPMLRHQIRVVKKEIAHSMMNHENARVLWDELENCFGKPNALHIINLGDDIHACK
ncbi:unnamed protein product [Linum trigynum]|uniref:Uncharacterized protein n=1 Tax=Linum trigynum TaxID=586398 RepID=A0AAV2FY26_9ROSI